MSNDLFPETLLGQPLKNVLNILILEVIMHVVCVCVCVLFATDCFFCCHFVALEMI